MEDFVKRARESTVPSNFGPVHVNSKINIPIIPINRWQLEDKKQLRKCYKFDSNNEKNLFVSQLLQYESTVDKHAIEIKITKDCVELLVGTTDLQTLTDLDKDYCKMADNIFKDVVYIPLHGFTGNI